ncbi:NAD(P)H-binding protein [Dickeya dianthicola]|uniref:NmrA family NAD(P)-binding protein n=1 Tax=Dickeya dianthicola TaxID=204039 RepID=UPI00136AAE3D|nr:NmrA family NAD(P)-binding protein [Dickeya dianthicola]MCI4237717.1 NmrA family NAD(P)-binding protein [Dickeya dianthicola]MCI4255632.1 NmrA family NAD(P)-binding protein [Dickeya dianthicola]MZG23863.1 NAD(P)H-binding protein [Dickeya dianthicola]MZI90855.1 NAD(P)H-binding protein [Dickeya dianthicola]
MSDNHPCIVLVTGATGMQGAGVARNLLSGGYHVRALTTDATSEKAKALRDTGAELYEGSFEDLPSLARALQGVEAVFSLQLTDPSGQHQEVTQAKSLIKLAKKCGVRHFIQTTVSGAGQHANADWFKSDKWSASYWNDKMAVQDEVRKAGFERYTILKPALFMENLLPPKAAGMYVGLETGRLVSRVPQDVRLAWISSETLGYAVRFCLENPDVMNGCELELADTLATPSEIAAELEHVTGLPVKYEHGESQTMLDMGFRSGVINAQEWQAEVGYPAVPEMANRLGISTLSFREWAILHKDDFEVS